MTLLKLFLLCVGIATSTEDIPLDLSPKKTECLYPNATDNDYRNYGSLMNDGDTDTLKSLFNAKTNIKKFTCCVKDFVNSLRFILHYSENESRNNDTMVHTVTSSVNDCLTELARSIGNTSNSETINPKSNIQQSSDESETTSDNTRKRKFDEVNNSRSNTTQDTVDNIVQYAIQHIINNEISKLKEIYNNSSYQLRILLHKLEKIFHTVSDSANKKEAVDSFNQLVSCMDTSILYKKTSYSGFRRMLGGINDIIKNIEYIEKEKILIRLSNLIYKVFREKEGEMSKYNKGVKICVKMAREQETRLKCLLIIRKIIRNFFNKCI